MLDGYAAGRDDAFWALEQTKACGIFNMRSIYFACDFDIQPSQYAVADRYLNGVSDVLGFNRTGVYAGINYIEHQKHQNLYTAWFWQTVAWSRGLVSPNVHLYQDGTQVTLDGVQCDVNVVKMPDWGQINQLQGDSMSAQDVSNIFDEFNSSAINTANGRPDRLTPYIDNLSKRIIQHLQATYPETFPAREIK